MRTGYIDTLLGGIQADLRRALKNVFDHFVEWNELGPVSHHGKLTNFKGYYVQTTTSTTADAEFSVRHGLGVTPYVLNQVLPLDGSTRCRMVPLTMSREADRERVYLRSPTTNVVVTLWVEG